MDNKNLNEDNSVLEERLRGYEKRLSELLSSEDDKINAIVCIMGLFTFFGFMNLDIMLSVELGYLLGQILLVPDLHAMFMSIGMMVLGIPMIGIIDVLTFRKISRKMKNKSRNRIMASQEYIDLVRIIGNTEQLLRNTNKSIPEPNIEEANKRIGVALRKFGMVTDEEPSKPYTRRRNKGDTE